MQVLNTSLWMVIKLANVYLIFIPAKQEFPALESTLHNTKLLTCSVNCYLTTLIRCWRYYVQLFGVHCRTKTLFTYRMWQQVLLLLAVHCMRAHTTHTHTAIPKCLACKFVLHLCTLLLEQQKSLELSWSTLIPTATHHLPSQ